MIALTLNDFLKETGLTKKELGISLGYSEKTASQNVNKFKDRIFILHGNGWKIFSERRYFELPSPSKRI